MALCQMMLRKKILEEMTAPLNNSGMTEPERGS